MKSISTCCLRAMPGRLVAASMTYCLLATANASTAGAQAQPLILQHGIQSDSSTWYVNGAALTQLYNVTTYRFTTGSGRTYEDQAATLFNYTAGFPDTTIAVGHSNGGIVARQVNRMGRNLKGIVTVATPHHGALLAQNASSGVVSWYFSNLLNVLGRPAEDYVQFYNIPEDPDHAWVATAINVGIAAFNLMSNSAAWTVNLANMERGILDEMAPASGFLENASQGINSSGNTTRETAAIPNRVAIVSTLTSNSGLIFRAGFSAGTASSMVDARNVLIGGLFVLFNHYYNYQNQVDQNNSGDDFAWDKEQYAYEFMDAALALYYTDSDWCGFIGAQDPSSGGCGASDAIVPHDNQIYPGYTRLLEQFDVAHVEETTSFTTLQSLRSVFQFGPLAIAPRGTSGGGGGGAPIASISGPNTVNAYNTDTWGTTVSGGQSPYTYVWSVDGSELQRGSNDYFNYANSGSDFTVTLTVIDAAGASVSSSLYVMVQNCGGAINC